MRLTILSLVFILLLISVASADILINTQPEDLYNLQDVVTIPVKITTTVNQNNFFTMNLLCNGIETEIYKEYLVLTAGDEKSITASIPLIQGLIGRTTGICKIKSSFGEQFLLSEEFTISNKINIEIKQGTGTYNPGQEIIIEGEATKENGGLVNGLISLDLKNGEETISITDTVKNGYFYQNLSLPADTTAGEYLVQIEVYETDSMNRTNTGLTNFNLIINQIPTSLEIVLETPEVEPGTNLQAKAILHDQTGEPIKSVAIITVKNEKDTILTQEEISTDEFLVFPIAFDQPPIEWQVVAVSQKLTAETTFEIIEKSDVEINIINKTLTIKNIGNVPFNDTITIKIGNSTVDLDLQLKVNEIQEYTLTAPDGEYEVEIFANDESRISENVLLTGSAIDVQRIKSGAITLIKHPIVWVFIIALLAFLIFMVIRKGYKRSFFGYIHSRKRGPQVPLQKNSLVKSSSKAELSLSIKGDKQEADVICLNVKNLKEIQSTKSNAEETLQKIVDTSENQKAFTYENQNNLFFILAPVITKTFKNEKASLDIAQKIKNELEAHNKLSKQKIDYGISIHTGSIIAKQEEQSLKFMSMGTMITTAKRLASIPNKDIAISEKMNSKLLPLAKTKKHDDEKLPFYTITELKHKDPENKKFISNFIKKLEGDKKKD